MWHILIWLCHAPGESCSEERSSSFTDKHDARQTLSGKVPFSHIKSDLRVAFEKYKGISPARPKNPPIQDAHWDLVSECWGEASTRPSIDDVQASIMTLRAWSRDNVFLDVVPSIFSRPLCIRWPPHCPTSEDLFLWEFYDVLFQ